MRLRLSHVARATTLALVCSSALLGASSASAATPPRNVQFDVPSLQGNIDVKRVQFNKTNKLTAWVRLPAGYDEQPDRKWPVLYLLHGWEDNSGGWLDPQKGSLASVLPADFDGIVVMPEGAKDWFVNWASDTANPGHQWGDYLREEVVPFMEENLRILPGRGNHAIGGLSMGGFGALHAVSEMPTYFGHALSFSGLLDNQDGSFNTILNLAQLSHPGYGSVFGSLTGPYAASVNPLKSGREFAGSRVTVTYGTPGVAVLWSLDLRIRGEATLEVGTNLQAGQFIKALRGVPVALTVNNRNNGSHTWRWWKMDLADSVKRGLFTPPPITETSQATTWEYSTMASHGNAWGLGYQLAAKPTRQLKLIRNGSLLEGQGSGTIRISGGAADADASGNGTRADCTYTLKLPFKQELPAGC